MGYLFRQSWSAASEAEQFITDERAGVAYVDQLTVLLARLTAAQNAAIRGTTVDAGSVRAAVGEVEKLDPGSGDPLQIRVRWEPLARQIDAALREKGKGQQAVRTYTGPISLTHGLLGTVGDASKLVRDPELDSYHLMDTAMFQVPDVLVSAGQLSALAQRVTVTPNARVAGAVPQIAVAQDRLASSAEAISLGLRAGNDATRSDTLGSAILEPLDDFVAAVDALVKASTALSVSKGGAAAEVDTAARKVSDTALALDAAVIAELDTLLERRADDLVGDRRLAVAAGLTALIAVALVPWLRRRRTISAPTKGADGPPAPNVVDARELIAPDLVSVGRAAASAGARRQPDDPR
jgi:hypothetical protein